MFAGMVSGLGSHLKNYYHFLRFTYSPAQQIFRKEPFFYGHDNYDQLVKIAKVYIYIFQSARSNTICFAIFTLLFLSGCYINYTCKEDN